MHSSIKTRILISRPGFSNAHPSDASPLIKLSQIVFVQPLEKKKKKKKKKKNQRINVQNKRNTNLGTCWEDN